MDSAPSFVPPALPIAPASIAHLKSNSEPEGLEERIARGHVAELEKQAAFFDHVTAACASQRADLERSLMAHKSILSPIRRLPNELLAEIFSMVVLHLGLPGWSEPWVHPPWTLARVCRRWSAIALGTPELWSGFYSNLDLIGLGQGAVKMTELLHQRSGRLPLTVAINEDYKRETRGILDVALARCERWRYLELNSAGGLPLLSHIATIRGRLPALTTLKVYADFIDVNSVVELRDVFAVAPNLTAVHACFENEDHDLARPPFEFPWRQLTTLSISFTRNEEVLPLFPQISSIVNLRVQYTEAVSFPAQSPITFPRLRMLEIKMQDGLDPAESPSLLSCFTTPLLVHLGIHDEADKDAVVSFIVRSECKLQSFHFLHATWVRVEDVLSLVHEMPHLRDLKIGDLEGTLNPPPGPDSPAALSITQALHSHWLAVRSKSEGSRLFACIGDDFHPHIDPEVDLLMQNDGLFIQIDPEIWRFKSLVDAKFEEY